MGMANSDDEAKIMIEHDLMENIKKAYPFYYEETHGMSDDARAIYDHSLKEKFREMFRR